MQTGRDSEFECSALPVVRIVEGSSSMDGSRWPPTDTLQQNVVGCPNIKNMHPTCTSHHPLPTCARSTQGRLFNGSDVDWKMCRTPKLKIIDYSLNPAGRISLYSLWDVRLGILDGETHTVSLKLRWRRSNPTKVFHYQNGFDKLISTNAVVNDLQDEIIKFKSVLVQEGKETTELGIPIDSGIGLQKTIGKLRVFINKTLSTESLINQLLLIRGLDYQLLLIVGKVGQGMRSCHSEVYKTRSQDICWWVSVTMTSVCQWHNGKCVYVSVSVSVCVIPKKKWGMHIWTWMEWKLILHLKLQLLTAK